MKYKMNYYRIKSILHSGRKGDRYSPRTDGRYPSRINRIVQFDEKKSIIKGIPFVFDYVKDEHGNDYSDFYFRTSYVVDWDFISENMIRVETNNSIYEFERVEEV